MADLQPIENPDDIQINETDEVRHLLGAPPGWLLRWGITVIICFFGLMLVLSYLIKYPDDIRAVVVITTERPPIRETAMSSGEIDRFFVSDQDTVQPGALLALLKNPANWRDILLLDSLLKALKVSETFTEVDLPADLELGELQALYSTLSQRCREYLYYQERQLAYQKIRVFQNQIGNLKDLDTILHAQLETMEREVALAAKDFGRSRQLDSIGAEPDFQVEQAEARYLQYARQLEDLRVEIINNRIKIEELEMEVIDLKQNRSDELTVRKMSLREDIKKLESGIDSWKQLHLIEASIPGRVVMSGIWSTGQFVRAGEEVLTLLPLGGAIAGTPIGRAQLPGAGAGKVRTGMPVNIRLEEYPFQEYGVLKGEVTRIAPIPEGANYRMEIGLPDPLVTTYRDTLPFSQEMKGSAYIITEDRRIIERIFDKLLSLTRNN